MDLNLRAKQDCLFDEISLGEVMLRLDPGDGRIKTARTFRAWEGGGEYNVARGLRRCFGLHTAVVTALADNEVGRLIEDFILQGGVDTSLIEWKPYDGIGRSVRNGLNFTERGFGLRGAVGVSDRGHTAASQLKPGDIDWDFIFGRLGARWLHTGGIFAALSETTAQAVLELLDYYEIPIEGKRAVVLGRSLVVGRPAAMLLLHRGATVTLCHSKTENAAGLAREADILVAAAGRRESVGAAYFRAGQTVIDVGIHYNEETQKLCGDVALAEADGVVRAVTPVPGGVGALTTAVLAAHTAKAAARRIK